MMRHREASRQLVDLLAGDLSADRQSELAEHLEICEECRDWSETYGFLSDSLRADDEADHPSSEQLAHLAVDAESLTAPERGQLATHLEECDECRRELELSREALAAGREEPAVARLPLRLPSRAVALRLALAASMALALGLAFIANRSNSADHGPPAVSDAQLPGRPVAGALGAGQRAAAHGDQDRRLDEEDLVGTQVIEAEGVLAANSNVQSGSDITLRAGEMVFLGDGFSIGSSANLGIEIAPRPNSDLDSDSHS